MAHEHWEDGCHSPAAVLGRVKGMQPEPDLVYFAFSAICEIHTLTQAGYAKVSPFPALWAWQCSAGYRKREG